MSQGLSAAPPLSTHTDTPAVPLWGYIKNSAQMKGQERYPPSCTEMSPKEWGHESSISIPFFSIPIYLLTYTKIMFLCFRFMWQQKSFPTLPCSTSCLWSPSYPNWSTWSLLVSICRLISSTVELLECFHEFSSPFWFISSTNRKYILNYQSLSWLILFFIKIKIYMCVFYNFLSLRW